MAWIQSHVLNDPVIALCIVAYLGLLLLVGMWATMTRPLNDRDLDNIEQVGDQPRAVGRAPCGLYFKLVPGTPFHVLRQQHMETCWHCLHDSIPERSIVSDQRT